MNKKLLIVYVPGFKMTVKDWEPLISRLREETELSSATWKGWDHHRGPFSAASSRSIATDLKDAIDAEWWLTGSYDEVVLIGHSVGGVLVRQAYLLASGCYAGEPDSEWPKHVKRIVLLAAVNRGLDQNKWEIRLYDLITRLLGVLLFRHFTGQDLISGSEFITDLRLKWITHMRSLPSDQRPAVYQIIGTKDSFVTRRDSIDLEQFPNATHMSVPDVTHNQLPLIRVGPNPEMRYRFIRDAIFGHKVQNADRPPHFERKDQVVFVLHGIRAANRGWVQHLDERVIKSLPNAEVVTPGYGYLSALEFVVPFLHRRPIRKFQQLYSDYFVQNPGAKFHFVGHSNGTYILGQSLKSLTAMRFNRVFLAGSVLPRDFPWRELMSGTPPQVNILRNDCANSDWPVGFLCSGLTGLARRDIGTGGYEGFLHDDRRVFQYWFHGGGHGAALEKGNINSIAGFLLKGDDSSKPRNLVGEKRGFSFLSRLAPSVFRVVVLLLAGAFAFAAYTSSIEIALGVGAALVIVAFVLKVA